MPTAVPRKHVLRNAMLADDPADRARLLAQACPDIDQDRGLAELDRARADLDARRGYSATNRLQSLLDQQRHTLRTPGESRAP